MISKMSKTMYRGVWWRYLLWCGIAIAVLAAWSACGSVRSQREPENLRFVFFGPAAPGSHQPLQVVVYTLGSTASTLDSLWAFPKSTPVECVRVYPSLGSVLIVEGYPTFGVANILSTRTLQLVDRVDLTSLGQIQYVEQFDNGRPFGQLAVSFLKDKSAPSTTRKTMRVSPAGTRESSQAAEEPSGELRLGGVEGPRTGGGEDVAGFRRVTSSPPQTISDTTGIYMQAFPVPDSVVVFKTPYYWIMFAHEPEYMALVSVPERQGLSQTEILLFNRRARNWNSILVPGDVSKLRPLNGWITGDVAHSNPDNDWARRTGYPAIVSDSSILIDPLTLKTLIVELGHNAQFLWVEGDTAYYRVTDSLFRARIGESSLADRQLLLVDPRVEHIHWAFRGGEAVKE